MSTLTDRIQQEIEQAIEAKSELCQNYRDMMETIESEINTKTNELNAQLDDLEHCDVALVTSLRHEIRIFNEDKQSADVMLHKCLNKQAITPEVARGYCEEISEEFNVLTRNTLNNIKPNIEAIIAKCDDYLGQYRNDYFPVHGKARKFASEVDKNGYTITGKDLSSFPDQFQKLKECLKKMNDIIEYMES